MHPGRIARLDETLTHGDMSSRERKVAIAMAQLRGAAAASRPQDAVQIGLQAGYARSGQAGWVEGAV
jgi:hypothetical protein